MHALDAGFVEFETFVDGLFDFGVHVCVSRGVIATFMMEYGTMTVKAFKVRMPYDPSEDRGIEFDPDEGLTQQQFKDECDINNIMKRYMATGVITHVNGRAPEFGDFSNPVDFQRGLNTVIEAQAMFDELPATLCERFGNDPLKLLEFVADENNRDEAIELGIVQAPPEEPKPQKVEVVNPAPPAPPSTPQPKAP